MDPKKQEILPATAIDMTHANLEYSVKIGKQVIKQELEKKIIELNDHAGKLHKQMQPLFDEKQITKQLKTTFTRAIAKEEGITKMRELINYFNDTDIKHNKTMIAEARIDITVQTITKPLNFHDKKRYQTIINRKWVAVPYTAHVAFHNEEEIELNEQCKEINAEFEFSLTIPKPILIQMIKANKILINIMTLEDAIQTSKEQLSNIDKTMEEMEARLLVQELAKSNHGKDVLAVTSEIVKNIVGDTPLLSSF